MHYSSNALCKCFSAACGERERRESVGTPHSPAGGRSPPAPPATAERRAGGIPHSGQGTPSPRRRLRPLHPLRQQRGELETSHTPAGAHRLPDGVCVPLHPLLKHLYPPAEPASRVIYWRRYRGGELRHWHHGNDVDQVRSYPHAIWCACCALQVRGL